MSNIKWESAKHLETGDPEPKLQADLLTLYSMRFCPFAQRTRLVLQHKQIPHQIVNVNTVKKPDWYLTKGSNGKVPLLVERDGWTLDDSGLTAEYLELAYPELQPLYPADPKQKIRMRQIIAKYSDALVGVYYKWLMVEDDAQRKVDWENLLKFLDGLQTELGDSNFFGGSDKFQMADLMLWPVFERIGPVCQLLGFELPKERFSRLLKWIDRMGRERAVIEVRVSDSVQVEFFKPYRQRNPRFDGF